MCGIAGIFNKNTRADIDALKKMTDAIAHRGPDGEGHWISNSGKVALGHRRLSIIDLSDNGKQPMHYLNRYTITFNGEIYNYIELKNTLVQKGYKFESKSDTEVLLALFDLKREKCLEDLDGMFAFAIWDEKEQQLFCARDRFGEKPFFYHHDPEKQFAFASEMKSLWQLGIKKQVNPVMMVNFLNNVYSLDNPSRKSDTFYQDIHKLEPAHYLVMDSELRISKKKYWDINPLLVNRDIREEQAIEKFRELFSKSVKHRLRSDVPVGSSLSGGLDSSSIVCLINSLNSEHSLIQKTFSARFKNYEKDEGKFMEAVIKATHVDAHFCWPAEEQFITDFDKMFYHQEEPFSSASIFAQWSVMMLAKQNNVTVLLDGQGADEMLAGYHYYFSTYFNELYRNGQDLYKHEVNCYRKMHNPEYIFYGETTNPSPIDTISRRIKSYVRPVYKAIFRNSGYTHNKSFLHRDYLSQFTSKDFYSIKFDGNLNQQLYYSTCTSGLETLLRYADRNSMAHSREVRLPFLSHQLVEFVFALPSGLKIRDGWTKYLLRKSMENILPPEITWRVDKIGYEPPQKKWLSDKRITEKIQDSKLDLEKRKIINPDRNKSDDNDWLLLMAAKTIE